MADSLLAWVVKKVNGLFVDVDKLKTAAARSEGRVGLVEKKITNLAKVQDALGRETEGLKGRVTELESQNHGLKVARGRYKAQVERLKSNN